MTAGTQIRFSLPGPDLRRRSASCFSFPVLQGSHSCFFTEQLPKVTGGRKSAVVADFHDCLYLTTMTI